MPSLLNKLRSAKPVAVVGSKSIATRPLFMYALVGALALGTAHQLSSHEQSAPQPVVQASQELDFSDLDFSVPSNSIDFDASQSLEEYANSPTPPELLVRPTAEEVAKGGYLNYVDIDGNEVSPDKFDVQVFKNQLKERLASERAAKEKNENTSQTKLNLNGYE